MPIRRPWETADPNPTLQERSRSEINRQNAYARYGGRLIVRLDDPRLSPSTRDAIRTLVQADEALRRADGGAA